MKKLHPYLRLATLYSAFLLTLVSCESAENEFDTTFRASFYYRGVSTKQALRSALESMGVYCEIYVQGKTYIFRNNQNQTDSDNMLSLNNGTPYLSGGHGFIVGKRSEMDMKGRLGVLYAYDRVCPNCYKTAGGRRIPLNVDAAGSTLVECKSGCHRIYDLNKEGHVVEHAQSPKDYKLIRYQIKYDALNGAVSIYN